MIGASIKLKI